MAVQAQHTLDVLDHWIQGTMRVIWRTSEPNTGVAFPCHVRTQYPDPGGFAQRALAHAGLPTKEHHLPQPRFTLLPASQEKPEFLLAPNQEGQSGRGRLSL